VADVVAAGDLDQPLAGISSPDRVRHLVLYELHLNLAVLLDVLLDRPRNYFDPIPRIFRDLLARQMFP
jgi:hypothetical protein